MNCIRVADSIQVMNDPEKQLHIPSRLMSRAGVRGWLVPMGLVLVLISNVIALFLPFLDIEIVLKGSSEYKLPESVKLMWETGLYWVAILIVCFSIIFPLAKTISLLITWFLKLRPDRRKSFIRLLETLGKWSMLDVFVVILLMVLSNEQVFLSTTPRIGLTFFIFAIIGNMIMSRIVATLDDKIHPEPDAVSKDRVEFMPMDSTGGLGWAIPLLLLISFLSIIVAAGVPFLKINDILLHSNSYSIMDATIALWREKRIVLGIFLFLFVAVMPAVRILLIGRLWFSRKTRADHYKRMDVVRIAGEWSMMSVFLLALVMILTEGRQLVNTKITGGLYAIMISTAICVISLWAARWLLKSRTTQY
jgi:paraquat-inducible protein A